MSSARTQDRQSKDDKVQKNPMHSRHRALCGALDRLLTIGSYYQPSHARFISTARAAEEAFQKAVAGFETLEIFVQGEGLIIHDGYLAGDEAEGRRLFQLLEPLHVAILEIDATATSDHLHLAFSALKKAHAEVGKRVGYAEVRIKGLPETVRTVGRSLFLKTRVQDNAPPPGPAPSGPDQDPAEQVRFFQHDMVTNLGATDSERSRLMEREFVGIVQGILSTIDPSAEPRGEDGDPLAWVPPESLGAIQGILSALAGTGADLMTMDHLIAHARSSLQITGDPELVELVFQRMQKTGRKLAGKQIQPKLVGKGSDTSTRAVRQVAMSLDEMKTTLEGLQIPLGPMPDPLATAGGNCLAVCLQVMQQQPTADLTAGIEQTILRILSAPGFDRARARAVVPVLAALLDQDDPGLRARMWPMIWGPVQRNHPGWTELLWRELWPGLSSRLRLRAWPYLVNDLLLGLPVSDRIAHFSLLDSLSRVEDAGEHETRVVLENLPALQEQKVADGFFDVPPPLLYPVHRVLVGTSLSGYFGPLLHRALVQQAPHPLSAVLLAVMDGYQPTNRAVYQAILDQGIEEKPQPELADLGADILAEALADLHWDYMEEAWVVPAITWLGELGREPALPILTNILDEKKYMVLNSWPLEAREAAGPALARLRERLIYKGQGEVTEWTTESVI